MSSSTTYPPLMQNSHNDGSAAALQILCIFLLMWEIMYHIARICIKKCLDRYQNIIVVSSDFFNGSKDDNKIKLKNGQSNNIKPTQSSDITSSAFDDAKQTLTKRGPSYVISFLHSIYVTFRGINHLYELWYASNLDKLYIPSIDLIDSYRYAHLHVATTNTLFLSYLMYDLIHVIHQYPKLGGVDTIVHHTLFALCSVINGTYGLMAFQFGWLIIGEVSTIFLNIRWFLLKSGRGGESVLLDKVNGMFAITFFISRIGVYTIGIIHLFWYSYDELISLPEVSDVPVLLLSMTCGSMLLGWALNVLWGYKILAMVGKSSKTKGRKKD